MKATVDQDVCVGCEQCTQTCPNVFKMGPAGTAVAGRDDVRVEDRASCRDAAADCPVGAITIEKG